MKNRDVLNKFELSKDVDINSLFTEEELSSLALEYENYDVANFINLLDAFESDKSTDAVEFDRLEVIAKEDNSDFVKIGETALSKGRVALFIMAGGMGSRLGIELPKGLFEIVDGMSIYELLFKRLTKVGARVGFSSHVFILLAQWQTKALPVRVEWIKYAMANRLNSAFTPNWFRPQPSNS